MQSYANVIVALAIIVPIVAAECNEKGGISFESKCVCFPGYTGERCEIFMFETEKNPELAWKSIHNIQAQILNTKISNLERFKRAEEVVPEDTATGQAAETGTVDDIISGSGQMPVCLDSQITSSDRMECIDIISFKAVLITGSSESTTDLNKFIIAAKREIFFVNFELLPSSDSMMIEGILKFNKSANYSIADVNLFISKLIQKTEVPFTAFAEDFNECSNNSNICGLNNICNNTEGSFVCECSSGFKDESLSDLMLSQPRTCQPLCTDSICRNSGTCFVDNLNEARCSCNGWFSGDRCENAVDSQFRVATIVLGVFCGLFFLILLILMVIYLSGGLKSKKKETSDLPMVTGYKNAAVDEPTTVRFGGNEDENNGASHSNKPENVDKSQMSTSTSTFKPNETEDDKL